MPTYQAIINTPGYLSNQDDIPEFETAQQAWGYLASERQRDLEDDMNDDADSALDEMDGHAADGSIGTVWGTTPGYDGDHDLGLAYTVVRTELGPKDKGTQHFMACASMPANQPGWEI